MTISKNYILYTRQIDFNLFLFLFFSANPNTNFIIPNSKCALRIYVEGV